jgi:hypothetical protein
MNLSPYIESVRAGVTNASSLADEHTRQVAERLGTAIESSTRLALIEALSDAASTLSAELAPTSVELRMAGADPEFAVSVPAAGPEPTLLLPDPESIPEPDGDASDLEDEALVRITLRLPQSVKAKVDERADADGISTNAWLVGAVMDALAGRGQPGPGWFAGQRPPVPPGPGVVFGPNGPFGPHGVFSPHGPFGAAGLFGGKPDRPQWDRGERGERGERGQRRERGEGRRERGNVQGWVR